ncbi:MAG: permease-like cell division protein FtsX [Chloroflexota bacterium]|jgi:cell division transport system permease protein
MHFVRFSVRQAVQGLWRNSVMTFAATFTMILMLVLLAALVIVINGVESGLEYVESRVEVRAELHDGVLGERVDELQARVLALPEVAAVTYTSKEEALAEFLAEREAAGQDTSFIAGVSNPLYAYLTVDLLNPRETDAVTELLRAETGLVRFVPDQQTGIDRLVELTAELRNLGFILLSFVAVTVLLIVVNSIRMALMARAQEIEIMRLVGASDRYVRWPFLLEGVLIGLAGAVITLLLLLIASPAISDIASDIAGSVPLGFDQSLTLQITAIVLGAGLALGGLGAWISVRTYLR